MKIVYATDLHGNVHKYNALMKIAKAEKADIIVNGGDMLPFGNDFIESQGRFIHDVLVDFCEEAADANIHFAAMLGNDDLAAHDAFFDAVMTRPYCHNIAGRCTEICGYDFIGMNLVPDVPFLLKDRCRRDNADGVASNVRGKCITTTASGIVELENWPQAIKKLPTIGEELNALPAPKNPRKAIFVCHTPPVNAGFDVCRDRRAVGSKSVFDYIKKNNFLLSFHGHIHESPEMTTIWKNSIGHTVCIQPGQERQLICVVGDLDAMKFERFRLP